jgi:hypothetical protein
MNSKELLGREKGRGREGKGKDGGGRAGISTKPVLML